MQEEMARLRQAAVVEVLDPDLIPGDPAGEGEDN